FLTSGRNIRQIARKRLTPGANACKMAGRGRTPTFSGYPGSAHGVALARAVGLDLSLVGRDHVRLGIHGREAQDVAAGITDLVRDALGHEHEPAGGGGAALTPHLNLRAAGEDDD